MLWHLAWPGGDPGALALALLSGGAALTGTAAALRPFGRLPRSRALLLARAAGRIAPELAVAALAAYLLTHRLLAVLLVLAWLRAVRRRAFARARLIGALARTPRRAAVADAARGVPRSVLAALGLVALGLLVGGRDGPGLLGWHTAPLALLAGACGLVLVAGTQQAAAQARFRQAGVAWEVALDDRWRQAAGALIVAVLVLAALLPPLPALLSLHRLQALLTALNERLLSGAAPAAQSAPPAHAPAPGPAPPARLLGWAVVVVLGAMLFAAAYTLYAEWRKRRRRWLAAGSPRRPGVGQGLASFIETLLLLARGFVRALADEVGGRRWRDLARGVWRSLRQALAALGSLRPRWRWPFARRRVAGQSRSGAAPPTAAPGARPSAGPRGRVPRGPRRRIRALYRRFLAASADGGLARPAWRTPSAHRSVVAAAEPEAAEGVAELTAAYEWARFSPHPVTRALAGQAQAAWQGVRGVLRRRMRGGPPAVAPQGSADGTRQGTAR